MGGESVQAQVGILSSIATFLVPLERHFDGESHVVLPGAQPMRACGRGINWIGRHEYPAITPGLSSLCMCHPSLPSTSSIRHVPHCSLHFHANCREGYDRFTLSNTCGGTLVALPSLDGPYQTSPKTTSSSSIFSPVPLFIIPITKAVFPPGTGGRNAFHCP